jgi:hypothetical protein
MIRPNLRRLVAAVACMTCGATAAYGQHATYGRHPFMPPAACETPIVDHYVPRSQPHWDQNQPIEHFVSEVASRSWMRLEFLMWSYSKPGNRLIGAPVSGLQIGAQPDQIDGMTVPFDVNDNLNGGASVGATLFPKANTLGGEDIPGIRGTLGVALNEAELELSFFGMEQSRSTYSLTGIADVRDRLAALDPTLDPTLGVVFAPNYALPLLTDGVVQDATGFNSLIFNDSFSAELGSQIWGTELIILSEPNVPGYGPSLQWLGGVRYINLDETFSINGSFDGRGLLPDRTTAIGSSTINNLYGPEVGLRMAYTCEHLTLSVTPRIMFGLNSYQSDVGSSITGFNPSQSGHEDEEFATTTQLNFNAELHLTPKFSVFGGYDFMWLTGVTRPFENIIYDSTSDGAGGFIPLISEETNITDFAAQGFSVGAVFRY